MLPVPCQMSTINIFNSNKIVKLPCQSLLFLAVVFGTFNPKIEEKNLTGIENVLFSSTAL